MPERFIPPRGGYENLLSFQKARIIYDATVWFADDIWSVEIGLMIK